MLNTFRKWLDTPVPFLGYKLHTRGDYLFIIVMLVLALLLIFK